MNEKQIEINSFRPTLTEQLTANFYSWERRGRGWEVYNFPVELEPPYEPFFHYIPSQTGFKQIDDGRKPTFLSSLIESIKESFIGSPRKNKELAEYLPELLFDAEPNEFIDKSPIKEVCISLPSDSKVTFSSMEQFLMTLSFCSFPLSFEIIGSHESIMVQMSCKETDFPQLYQQLQAYFPEAVLKEESNFLLYSLGNDDPTVVVDFGLSNEFMRPLRTYKNFDTDPLIGVIGALENLNVNEIGLFQIMFQSVSYPWVESIVRSVTDWEGKAFFLDAPEMIPLTKEKIGSPLFSAVIRVSGQGSSPERAIEIAKSIGSGLVQLSNPHSNELAPLTNEGYDPHTHMNDVIRRKTHRGGMLLNSEELVSLVHPPSMSVKSRKLVRELKKTKAAPSITRDHQLILGENYHQGETKEVSLSPEQRLRHMHVIGATGTGKTTLLQNMIIQDINNGNGISVLDPHGDLIDRILSDIPESRFQDVVIFDPSDADYSVGFNILSAKSEVEKNVISSDLVAVFKRLSTSWGDQMTAVLSNAIQAFLESGKGGTLSDLRKFLVEKDFRNSFLETVKDSEVVYFWKKEFPFLIGRPLGPILTRLNTFLRPKVIRYMVAQQRGLDFENILNSKKIFLAKLAQGLIGEENAYLLGALLVSKIHQVSMARQMKKISERENFYLYIDEFQNFITQSMASILSGARKYNLGLILAHQEMRQLLGRDTDVAHSVISNPGTRICFRMGDYDAEKLKQGFSYFDAKDMQNLGVGEALVRVERNEYDFNLKVSEPALVNSDLAIEKQEKLIQLSRTKYGFPKVEIEKKLNEELRVEIDHPVKKEKATKITDEKVTEEIQEKVQVSETPIEKESASTIKREKVKYQRPALEGKGGAQHKYLQNMIKKIAEGKGYKAIIEQPTPDGKGSVDVGLEGNGKRIACEISFTSTDVQELGNIEKCLNAAYDIVILCSQEIKTLEKVKNLASEKLEESDLKKVLFFQPEELYFYFEKEAAGQAGKEDRVKGYKVKIGYEPVKETDKKIKRESVGKLLLDAFKKRKEK